MVVIDTSIIIDHLRLPYKQSKLAQFVTKHPQENLFISIITIQELYEGRSTSNPSKEKDLITVLAGFKILPYTFDTAKLAGIMARDSKKPVELADAAIAATAISHHATLYTLNIKHFKEFKNLKLYKS